MNACLTKKAVQFIEGALIKNPGKTAPTRGFTGGRRRCHRRSGTSLYQLAEALFLGKQVPACTCLPRNSSSSGWYELVPARRRVIPRRAGQSLYRLAEK
ncbi:hypothetical protein PCANC_06108 [Puccinia coronata f. sp. avenae]|uniref:Uncharacterized protein n=1 Tax=Puccinia coronata f. sp. avenae TaxID=200324 RepID=A0A2N5SWR2_9BASI|nr:hypothetical protein PCANC_10872 [Puccinia coronata f. sp. avenae]PLW38374.1 hypothetical protein PCASD_10567 [Puccinia coronata f. sp. avenae]PLW53410.1 hypothetical protein PCANC_06108 [Puccinia coronata f. sp. avenae]